MLSIEKIKNLRSEKIAFFRFKKFDENTYLITNDIGKYSFLTKEEFSLFIEGKIESGEKYEELLKNGFIKKEGFENDMAQAYATKNHFLAYGPSLHIIVTTLRCNHKCQYCHAAVAPMEAHDMDMTKETADGVLDTIFHTSSPGITIEFQGGESLANWEVTKYIVEQAQIRSFHLGKKVFFSLVTNLTLMNEDKLDFLIQNNISISSSLDGDEEIHNYNRVFLGGNSFEQVTYWIKRINEEYKKRGFDKKMGALLTVTKKALPKYKEIIDTYVELGLDSIFIRSLNPYGFAEVDLKNLGYSSEDFFDFYKNSMEYIIELNKNGVLFCEQLTNIYLAKIFHPKDPNFMDNRSPCGACIGQVAYNYDGKIYSCDEGRMLGRMGDDNFMMAKLQETGSDTYKVMIESETTKIMVQASTLDGLPGYNENVYKSYIGVCPINSYKVNGSLYPNFMKDEKRKLDSMILDFIFGNMRDKEVKKVFENWTNGIKGGLLNGECSNPS
ncbi:His-Xaa-Ser system radical SAM maturase HxsB [Candidatus Gracilibacteria bacterium]|nr:His-Xaa-Ser system radical SAM maturase HxsB [Candidatus Gracilibacteria bacterium]NUJ98854.1 His-Xaa-Ser system radical SAM maturase HxsB [Candidatus Gracilibacteria bacterium]